MFRLVTVFRMFRVFAYVCVASDVHVHGRVTEDVVHDACRSL